MKTAPRTVHVQTMPIDVVRETQENARAKLDSEVQIVLNVSIVKYDHRLMLHIDFLLNIHIHMPFRQTLAAWIISASFLYI